LQVAPGSSQVRSPEWCRSQRKLSPGCPCLSSALPEGVSIFRPDHRRSDPDFHGGWELADLGGQSSTKGPRRPVQPHRQGEEAARVHTSTEVCTVAGVRTPSKSRKVAEPLPVAVLYVRVSTGQQAESGLSLEQQERTLRQAAEIAGYAQVRVIVEAGVSGKSMRNRPALREALELLAQGQASALLVAKIDRLARNTRDTLHLADLADAQGWRLMALDLALDTATPVGRLVLTVLAGVAEMERKRIGERHKDWHAAKRERGLVWGRDAGPCTEIPDQVRTLIVRQRDRGLSLRAIAEYLTTEGVPTARGGTWHASTIAAILKSPSTTLIAS
jgi:DNA invertase Pin-like site-specific DNA recombinase